MNSILDIVGSFAIAGAIMLTIIGFTLIMNDSSNQQILASINQNAAAESMEILKYDFSKIGFKASSNKILHAEDDEIKYLSDIDNNGTIDTIEYYTGSTSQMSSTINPNDFVLHRKINNTDHTMAIATDFDLTFYDSLGFEISHSHLSSSQTYRDRIKSIGIDLTFQSGYKIDNYYQSTDLKTIIRPKNLNY